MGTLPPPCCPRRTFSLRFKIRGQGRGASGSRDTIMGGEKMDRYINRFFSLFIFCLSFIAPVRAEKTNLSIDLKALEKSRILTKAKVYVLEKPRTVTADICERSGGDRHDVYSEGDYWWPDPENPEVVTSEGMENQSANFVAHRKSMIRLSDLIGTLVSAYLITAEEKYAGHASLHLKAWFVEEKRKCDQACCMARQFRVEALEL